MLTAAAHRIADEAVGADELRVDHVGAKQLADIAERRVGDVLHRGEEEGVMGYFERTEFKHDSQ